MVRVSDFPRSHVHDHAERTLESKTSLDVQTLITERDIELSCSEGFYSGFRFYTKFIAALRFLAIFARFFAF